MWTPHTVVGGVSESGGEFNPSRPLQPLRLGLVPERLPRAQVVTHGGGLDGMISQVALLPEENLGVVVLTNSETPLSTFLW